MAGGLLRRCIHSYSLIAALTAGTALFGTAEAGVVVRLVPDNPGPYVGGETIQVDIFLDNTELTDLGLLKAQFDFDDTSTGIGLPASMTWTLIPPGNGIGALPLPSWFDSTPNNVIPAQQSLQAGSVEITLRSSSECLALDVMNRDEPNVLFGAELIVDHNGSIQTWRAFHKVLTGGALGFPVGVTPSPELCNGVDDDCDGLIDEDFFLLQIDPVTGVFVPSGPGDECIVGEGTCQVHGALRCNAAMDGLDCLPGSPPPDPGVEGPYLSESCYDQVDGDCDGLVDEEDPDCQGDEICDGDDNDFDGQIDELWPNLGQPCTVGIGICQKNGVWICSADGNSSTCNVSPLPPGTEGPPGHPNCKDGIDGDCDGLTDLADPDCQQPEICDGKDNDGDDQIDENWPQLGKPCVVGLGICEQTGTIECAASQLTTQCSVNGGPPMPEGSGCDCADGLDNDCDGLTDFLDPDCSGELFRMHASLPVVCAPTDGDCRSWHEVQFNQVNGNLQTVVTADLIALDSTNAEVAEIPVGQGDRVRFRSRVLAIDQNITTVSQIIDYEAMAIHAQCVTGPANPFDPYDPQCASSDFDCDDDVDLRDAAALQRQFGEVSQYHDITAANLILRVHGRNATGSHTAYASPVPQVQVFSPDGVTTNVRDADVTLVDAALLNIDPSTLEVKLDGVDVLAALGINAATDLPGGPFGGTVPLPNGCSADICNLVIDMGDLNAPSANTLRMLVENMCCGGHVVSIGGEPVPDAYPDPAPDHCQTELKHDTGIANGFEVEIATPTDQQVIPNAPVAVTGTVCHGKPLTENLASSAEVFLNRLAVPLGAPIETIGDGVNSADKYVYPFTAALPETNTFEDVVNGNNAPGSVDRGSSVLVAEAVDLSAIAAFDRVPIALGPVIGNQNRNDESTPISRGLVLSLNSQALQDIVATSVESLFPPLVQEIENTILAAQGTKLEVPTDYCTADVLVFPDVPPIFAPVISLPSVEDLVIEVVPSEDQVDVTVTIPPASVSGLVMGYCQWDGNNGNCKVSVSIVLPVSVEITQAVLSLTVTEEDLLTGGEVVPSLTIADNDIVITVGDVGVELGCWLGNLIDFFTLGLADNFIEGYINDNIDDYIGLIDVSSFLAFGDVPPVPVDFLDFNPLGLGGLGVTLDLNKESVEITTDGLTMAVETTFTPQVIDPEIDLMPGIPDTIGDLPAPPIPAPAKEASVLIADDAMNQLLFALTQNGVFTTEFDDVATLAERLANVTCPTFEENKVSHGACMGYKGADCELLKGAAKGTCLGAQCYMERVNVGQDTPIVVHGEVNAPPRFLALSTPAPSIVRAHIRLPDVMIAAMADRDGDGVVQGPFGVLKSCTVKDTDTECAIWNECYDVNLAIDVTLIESTPPQLDLSLVEVSLSSIGACGQQIFTQINGIEDVVASEVFGILNNEFDSLPAMELDGLDFGGIVNFANLRMLTVGNTHDAQFEDYFGITADIE